MEKTTVIGIFSGLLCICISILLDGSLDAFIHLPSIFIVVGGTIAATVVAYPGKQLRNLIKLYKLAFKKKKIDIHENIEMIVNIANIARREGLLALEDAVEGNDIPFLKKGIMLIADGADTELIKSVLQTEIYFLQERHAQGQAIIKSMASYAPAYGMIGTLIGLITMLKNLDDPDTLGPGMATALITTFYGVLLANLVLGPIEKKLKSQTESECLQLELLMEGILSIQDGENPRIIRDKLTSFIAKSNVRKEIEQKQDNELKDGLKEKEVSHGR